MDCCENGSKSAVMTVEYSGTKQLNLDMVAPHIWGGQGIFQGGGRGGKAIFKVHGGGANHFSRYNFGLMLH